MSPLVMVVDDEESLQKLYSDTLIDAGMRVCCCSCAEDAMSKIQAEVPELIISDVRMPGMDGITFLQHVRNDFAEPPFLLITAYANVRDAVKSLKLGAVDYLAKPVDLSELKAAVCDTLGVVSEMPSLDMPMDVMQGIVADNHAMLALFNDAYRVARSEATALITGESGTGKEVFSQFIRDNSNRADKSFVTVNCAAIPANLLASELFGHEKGAFTGAINKRLGRFREADGGTLFLDEIGDMPLELQSSLLRAIENGVISPVGSDKEQPVNIRLIAATNKNLEEEVKNGNFREDLYYRLNVITFELLPPRERPEDVTALAKFFLNDNGHSKRLSSSAQRAIMGYEWPGNVRELANAMERAKILSRTDLIMPEQLPAAVQKGVANSTAPTNGPSVIKTLEQQEFDSIRKALEKTGGNQTKAAELLGISRRTLINKLKKMN